MLHIIGFNHKTAPLTVREQWARLQAQQSELSAPWVTLNTCNRTEFITTGDTVAALRDWLQQQAAANVEEYGYHYQNNEALRHLLHVACGLDSMVLGEPQILGQIKTAYAQAADAGQLGMYLGHVFPFVFGVAKKVRATTGISAHSLSIASTAVQLAQTIFSDIQQARVLLIGGGETVQRVAQHLHSLSVPALCFANRTEAKSHAMAQKWNGDVLPFADIAAELFHYDMVITATASAEPILSKTLLEHASKLRRHKPMFIVDLAMPRDVAPEAGELPDIYLYNLDDLQSVVQTHWQQRQRSAEWAMEMIEAEIEHFVEWQNSLQSVPTICAYRQQMEQLRDEQVVKAHKALQRGEEPEKVIERLAHDLTNKWMHAPTVEMRRAGAHGQIKFLEWARQLLQLGSTKS